MALSKPVTVRSRYMRLRIDNVDFAVDEHIWGHRLYDEQLPHLAVLDSLTVLELEH